MVVYQIYDKNFKNIFNTFPQGILDIVHDVIVENFPELIVDNCPQELFEAYPKELFRACPKELLQSDEFRLHFKQKLNNEFILKNGKKFVSDLPHLTYEDIVINLKFQSYKIMEDKKAIFNVYLAELHKEHKKHVITVVFSMEDEEHGLITHKINRYDGLTILIISLKALNQKQTLNNSNYKLTNGITMSVKEKDLFLLSSLMSGENRVSILKENILLTVKAKNLTEQERKDMLNIQLNFAQAWFNEEELRELGGLIMCILTPDAKECFSNIFKEIIEENARNEGIEMNKKFIVSNILANNLSFEETSKLTGLSVEEISKIANSK